MNQNDLIRKITMDKNQKQSGSLFGKDYLSNIHEKIMGRIRGNNMDNRSYQNSQVNSNSLADDVISADKMLRQSVTDLANALFNLGDKSVAQRLIGEHIMILNEIFKSFE